MENPCPAYVCAVEGVDAIPCVVRVESKMPAKNRDRENDDKNRRSFTKDLRTSIQHAIRGRKKKKKTTGMKYFTTLVKQDVLMIK